MLPLCVYLKHCFGHCTGISFIDATSIKVCHVEANSPSSSFSRNSCSWKNLCRLVCSKQSLLSLALRKQQSLAEQDLGAFAPADDDLRLWALRFKLHLVVNEKGELLNLQITAGNTDDRKPVPDLVESLFGKVFADRGYVSQPLAKNLLENFGIQFFAKPRRNMKNSLMLLSDKLLARKRSIIETSSGELRRCGCNGGVPTALIDQLKNISQIEHSRHRSPVNFGVNILCGLIAYCYQPKKPSLNLEQDLAQYAKARTQVRFNCGGCYSFLTNQLV